MANNCMTQFVLEGKRDFLKRLYDAIESNEWVGDIIVAAGIMTEEQLKASPEYNSCDLRASWYSSGEIDDNNEYSVLRFDEDSKWTRSSAMALINRILNEQVENGIIAENPISRICFSTEEPGCGIFEIHDEDGKYFDFNYSIYLCNKGDQEYFKTADEALEWIEEMTGLKFDTLEDAAADDDAEICVHEFEHVNEL